MAEEPARAEDEGDWAKFPGRQVEEQAPRAMPVKRPSLIQRASEKAAGSLS